MRKLLLALTLLGTGVSASGQTAPPQDRWWEHLQTIPAGSQLRVTALVGNQFSQMRTVACTFVSADAAGITCTRHTRAITFARSEVREIQTDKRLTAAAIGAGIGAGVGIGVEAATAHGLGFKSSKGSVVAASAGAGAILLAPVGYLLGWHTVYQVK
jgi:hypothetical protein